jgi:hypothetical protein
VGGRVGGVGMRRFTFAALTAALAAPGLVVLLAGEPSLWTLAGACWVMAVGFVSGAISEDALR